MANKPIRHVEYICSHCGNKVVRMVNTGKPTPGKCPRKQGNKPHTWTINRKF